MEGGEATSVGFRTTSLPFFARSAGTLQLVAETGNHLYGGCWRSRPLHSEEEFS